MILDPRGEHVGYRKLQALRFVSSFDAFATGIQGPLSLVVAP